MHENVVLLTLRVHGNCQPNVVLLEGGLVLLTSLLVPVVQTTAATANVRLATAKFTGEHQHGVTSSLGHSLNVHLEVIAEEGGPDFCSQLRVDDRLDAVVSSSGLEGEGFGEVVSDIVDLKRESRAWVSAAMKKEAQILMIRFMLLTPSSMF